MFRPSEDWVEREVMIALAGLAAEARHTGTYGWAEAERDLRYVRRLLSQTTERAAARLEKRLLAKVENLLADDDHWRAVELIAAELLLHGVISGRAARHMYERAVGAG